MLKIIILSSIVGLSNLLYADVDVVVSIVPQQTFVEKIGGEKVNVTTMVKAGSNPHSYEPKSSQMIALSQAQVYFFINLEFEKAWLEKFAEHNKKIEFSDMTKGIELIDMPEHNHGDGEKHNDEKSHSSDPHIWTSPKNVKIMAKNIYDTLVNIDSKNRAYYEENYNLFVKEIENTDLKIKNILSSLSIGSKFMVFHPSWGYFAKEYGLIQLAVEIEGKEPKPKMLEKIIKKAKREKVKVIFAQKEFSDKSARVLANELNIKVVKKTPLAKDWSNNLIKMADAIANGN